MSDDTIAVGFVEDNGGTNRLIQAVERLASSAEKMATAETRAAKATDTQGASARKAAGDTGYLASVMGQASSAGSAFAGVLGTLSAGFGLSQFVQYADTYTNMSNKLKLVTTDQKATNAAMQEAFAIAQRTYAPVEQTADLYGKLGATLRDTGKDVGLTGKLTEAFTGALKLSGATTQQTASATLQFTQAIGQSNIQMEEFGQLVDSAPALIDALAAGMKNGAGITRGELISMARQGQLTRDMLIDALGQIAPKVASAVAQSTPTVANAFNNLQNSVLMYIGSANSATGVTGAIASGMLFLANNINIVAPAVLALGAALAAIAVVTVGSMLAGLVTSFISLATAAAMGAIALGTTFAIPLAAVTVAVALLVAGLNVLGISFSQFLAMIPGGQALLDAWAAVSSKASNAASAFNIQLNGAKSAMGGAGEAAKSSAASNDNHAASSKKAGDATQAYEQKLKGYAQAAQQSQQASEQLAQSFNNVATSAAGSEARVDALSRMLRENYSSSAANAAQAAATLADNLYGSGSAAAMAASQYDQAAASANNYASAASAASSASSGFGGMTSSQRYGSGGTPAGSFPAMIMDTFQATYKGEKQGKELSVVKGGIASIVDSQYAIRNFDLYKAQVERANEIGNKYGFLSFREAMVLAANPDSYANFARIQKNSQVQAEQGRLYGKDGKTTSYDTYNQLYRQEGAGIVGFARGGDMKVGGTGGTDSKLVSFWASPNETVSVKTPAQRRREDQERNGVTAAGPSMQVVNVNLAVKDTDSIRQTPRQVYRDFAKKIGEAVA